MDGCHDWCRDSIGALVGFMVRKRLEEKGGDPVSSCSFYCNLAHQQTRTVLFANANDCTGFMANKVGSARYLSLRVTFLNESFNAVNGLLSDI